MRMPSSMPAGIFTSRVLLERTRPPPLHLLQGSLISCPVPWQVGQVCCTLKKPCCMRTAPAPRQVLHVSGEVPGLAPDPDRKSTRLNSSHVAISYAVFCLKKKKLDSRH